MKGSKYRQKYIQRALAVFKKEGLRLSLDEVADKMGITKKTLYNHFSSKDELFYECVHSLIADLLKSMDIMSDPQLNAIQAMRRGFDELAAFFMTLSPIFFFDMKKMYPELASTEHSIGMGAFREKLIQNLDKGIKENTYRKDMDVQLLSEFFIFSVFGFFISNVINNSNYTSKTYFKTVLNYHLRALATEKGKELI